MNLPSTLEETALALVAKGKGILAIDESFPTIEKRFKALNISSTEETRLAYRETLVTAPDLNEYISGVILFDETIRQKSGDMQMPDALARSSMTPGIKVDKGTMEMPEAAGGKITQGLDGLRERLSDYRQLGARFSKWRAVISIGDRLPTVSCITANAQMLALFAALSQEAGLVPIVEPEILMEGSHSLENCEDVTVTTLKHVFDALFTQGVVLEAMLLKTGMVLPGKDCAQQATSAEIAAATIRCLRRSVPAAIPGIVFLSGGQSEIMASERLNAICQLASGPWKLSFSFGRALQDSAMMAWKHTPEQRSAAQSALLHRARCNSLALQGKYSEQSERDHSAFLSRT